METLTSCPVCSNQNFSEFLECKDFTVSNELFKIVSCDSCGFKFTNPRPPEKDLGAYYESEEYVSHSNTSQGLINKLYQIARQYTLAKKLKLICSFNSKPGAILDYGCGTGELLNTCKKANWNTFGIEPSEAGQKYGGDHYGLEIYPDIFQAPFKEKSFDVITLWHVLEHVSQLSETLKKIDSLLKPNGHLIIAVPNPASLDAKIYGELWAAYDVPRHLYHFTPNSISTLLEKHRLKVNKTLPMPLDSFYVSLLSEKYKTQTHNSSSLLSPPKAFWNGLRSNINAIANPGTSSSQVYVVTKTVTK